MFFGGLTKFNVFRKCLELGKLVLNSGLLHNSCSRISEACESANRDPDSGMKIKIYQEPEYTTVVFVAPSCPLDFPASILLSGPQDQNQFHFLCSEKISSFSLHTPAYQLFDSAPKENLIQLRSEVVFSSTILSWVFVNKSTTTSNSF